MSLIHCDGGECMLSEVELFSVPPSQASIDKSWFVKYFPVTSLDSGPIEFHITTSETEYLGVSNIFLYTKNHILDGTGAENPEWLENDKGVRVIKPYAIVFPIYAFHLTHFK